MAETAIGLPGAGVEGVWVSVHDAGSPLDHLPPARAETKTDPQGAFAIALGGVGEWLIAVRAEPRGTVLAARRIVVHAGERPPELTLLVPLHERTSEQAAPDAPSPAGVEP